MAHVVSKKHLHWVEIHIATLLFGLAGLFGKFLDLPALWIVFGRVFFAFLALFVVIKLKKESLKLRSQKDFLIFLSLGTILALHWFTFFYAIKVSTVAIGLLSFSTFPIFVTFMEPYFFKEQLRLRDFIVAFVTFCGVALVVPNFDMSSNLTQGVFFGVASGLTFAIISLANRKYVQAYSGSVMAFYQDFFASLVLLPFVLLMPVSVGFESWALLIVLGVFFTALAHTMFINSMKVIKAQQASIVVSLEPLYGIVFAVFLLNEVPDMRTILGGVLILSAALYTTKNK